MDFVGYEVSYTINRPSVYIEDRPIPIYHSQGNETKLLIRPQF